MKDQNFLEQMPFEITDAICSLFSSRQSLRPLARTSKRLSAMVYLSDLAHLSKMTAEEQLHCLVTLYSTKIPWLSNTGDTNITNWLYHYLNDPAIGLLQRTIATKLLARVEDNDTHTRCFDKLMESVNIISPLLGYGLRSFFDKTTEINVNDDEISIFLDFWQTPKIEFQFCLQQISNDLLQPRKEEFFTWLKNPDRENTGLFCMQNLNHMTVFLSDLDKDTANNLLTTLNTALSSSQCSQQNNIIVYAVQSFLIQYADEANKNKYLDAIYKNSIDGLSLIVEWTRLMVAWSIAGVGERLSFYLYTIDTVMAELSIARIKNIYDLLKLIGCYPARKTKCFYKQRASVFVSLLKKLIDNKSEYPDILTDFLYSEPIDEETSSEWRGMKLRILREIYRELNPKQIDDVLRYFFRDRPDLEESTTISTLIELFTRSTKSRFVIQNMIYLIYCYTERNDHKHDMNHSQYLIKKITVHMQDLEIKKEVFKCFVNQVYSIVDEALSASACLERQSYFKLYIFTQFLAHLTLDFSENELNEFFQTALNPSALHLAPVRTVCTYMLVNIFRPHFVSDAEKEKIYKTLDNTLHANSTLNLSIRILTAGHYSRQQINLKLPTLIDQISKSRNDFIDYKRRNDFIDYTTREICTMRHLLTEDESYMILKKYCAQNIHKLPLENGMIDVWMLAEHLTDVKLQELFDFLGTPSNIMNHFFGRYFWRGPANNFANLPIHHTYLLKTIANLISRMQNKENKKIVFDELVHALVTRYKSNYETIKQKKYCYFECDEYKNSMRALTLFAAQIISSEEHDEIRAFLFKKSLSLAKINCGNTKVNVEAQSAFISAMFAIPLKRGVLLENANATTHAPSITLNRR